MLIYTFDWGDGSQVTTGFSPVVDHVYAIGTWVLTLTVVNDVTDTSDSATQTIVVVQEEAPGELQLTLLDESLVVPGMLRALISNAQPGETINFGVDGSTPVVASVVADDSGTVPVSSVPVSVAAGAHVLVATAAIGSASGDFLAIAESSPTDSPAPDLAPALPSPAPPVGRFVFWDPAAEERYTFPVNPTTMTSPFPEKVFATSATTSFMDGRTITFEGSHHIQPVTLTGTLLTEADYDELLRWYGKRYRFWLFDDFHRSWVVYFTAFDVLPKRDTQRRWTQTYSMTLLFFAGPWIGPTGWFDYWGSL